MICKYCGANMNPKGSMRGFELRCPFCGNVQ